MADKPSRALVIYGDGYAPLLSAAHHHLHSFASTAACGFLVLRAAKIEPDSEDAREVRELAQLLDTYDDYVVRERQENDNPIPTLPQRFMGLKAALITDSAAVKSFATSIGLTVLQIGDLIKQNYSSVEEVPDDSNLVSELLKLLGFSGGDVLEKFDFDLVILHAKSSDKLDKQKNEMGINTNVDWINKLVGEVMQEARPGSKIASRLHFSVVLGYGNISQNDESCSLMSNTDELNSDLAMLKPRQSYTMKGGKLLDDIRHHHPLLISQWQDGVTRRDLTSGFSFEEFQKQGGNLAILAERFLPEVAFKLWKAPKYGA